MKNTLMTAGLIGAAALAWAAKDPVLMTVNGLDVPKSEFEYLYHKNSQQQIEAQPLADYVEMFKIYKLKVADALAEGIDTTAAFRKEMETYRRELANPYLADSVYLNKLIDDSYNRSAKEAEAIHIMLLKPQNGSKTEVRAKADSLRKAILAGADYAEVAAKWSQDRMSKDAGGNMGFVTVNRFPYRFEEAVFETPEGEIAELVESPVAFHIVKGGKKRPARGTLLASHILKLVPKDATRAQQDETKAWVDSIAAFLKANPDKFESIAMSQSDDKGSARNGGLLPWFGAGMMVAPFDSAAFSLRNGEISDPVRTDFGWHIIKRIDSKEPESREALKAELLQRFTNPQDERHMMVRRQMVDRLARKHKAKMLPAANILKEKAAANGIDSLFYAEAEAMASAPFYAIGKQQFNVGDFISSYRHSDIADRERAAEMMQNYIDYFLYKKLVDAEETWLEANVPDYRNLLHEYRDGSLLYEVSVRKVWDRASKDTEGLQKFFEANRGNYTWTNPHVKGILVQAANDSVAGEVRRRLSQLGGDTIVSTARKEFGKKANIERVLVEKGANAMVDNLMFGAPEVKPASAAFTTYFLYEPVVLTAPEEINDVRGLVISDYQNQLEQDWIEEMKLKYPVTVNEKTLKKVK